MRTLQQDERCAQAPEPIGGRRKGEHAFGGGPSRQPVRERVSQNGFACGGVLPAPMNNEDASMALGDGALDSLRDERRRSIASGAMKIDAFIGSRVAP